MTKHWFGRAEKGRLRRAMTFPRSVSILVLLVAPVLALVPGCSRQKVYVDSVDSFEREDLTALALSARRLQAKGVDLAQIHNMSEFVSAVHQYLPNDAPGVASHAIDTWGKPRQWLLVRSDHGLVVRLLSRGPPGEPHGMQGDDIYVDVPVSPPKQHAPPATDREKGPPQKHEPKNIRDR